MNAWTLDVTMRYLNDVPLPEDFTWPHRDGGVRPVRPVHTAVIGYGKWLRETPYFPGLFELIHDMMEKASELEDEVWTEEYGTGEALAKKLRTLRLEAGLPDHEAGREALAHRLRPRVWTKDQAELPLK